ncbi:hypothetical protein EDF25_2933 [Curtobacterium sp. PhB131]|jgi:uracil-DNA glycosylase|nr:hypothetical protein EDF40_3278 [Curtobacterium sp. PhB170]ROS33552.1 hypothetical protein EDF25_2933 [Curtobacterium sp. PhB131]ROS64870.1 hypothetical protein EDF30_3286 [Curtobacterium sp. PhB141]
MLPELRAVVASGGMAIDSVMRHLTLHACARVIPVLATPHPSPANGRHR